LKAQFRFAGIAQIVNSIENNFFIYYSFRLARASFAQGLLPEQAAARHGLPADRRRSEKAGAHCNQSSKIEFAAARSGRCRQELAMALGLSFWRYP
jgi:hypothetical protein